MKSEKEILSEFVALVFKANDDEDCLSKKCLMNGSLSSVRQVANDAIEISSQMRKSDQTKLDAKLLSLGLPSLHSLQNKSFREFMIILNRGSIKKEQEYRLVRSISETEVLSNKHQECAYNLLECYEQART